MAPLLPGNAFQTGVYDFRTHFGALGDGVHDDSGALTQAMNTLAEYGGVLYIGPGVFVINGVVSPSLASPGIIIRGSGMYATTLLATKAGTMLKLLLPSEISDLTMDGGGVSACLFQGCQGGVVVPHAIARRVRLRNSGGPSLLVHQDSASANNLDRSVIEDVVIEAQGGSSANAISVNFPNWSTVRGLSVNNCGICLWNNIANAVDMSNVRTENPLIASQVSLRVIVTPLLLMSHVDTQGAQIDCARGRISDSSFTSSAFATVTINDFSNTPYLRFENCDIINTAGTGAAITNNGGALGSLQFSGCYLTAAQWLMFDNAGTGVHGWISFVDCVLDTAPHSAVIWEGSGATIGSGIIDSCNVTSAIAAVSSYFGGLTVSGTFAVKDSYPGMNPQLAHATTPAIAATGVNVTNNNYVDCDVYIAGGTVTAVTIAGTVTGETSGKFTVPVHATISITYSVAPTWVWLGH